jgi:hypothetical protein
VARSWSVLMVVITDCSSLWCWTGFKQKKGRSYAPGVPAWCSPVVDDMGQGAHELADSRQLRSLTYSAAHDP